MTNLKTTSAIGGATECPACRGDLCWEQSVARCFGCAREYPSVPGMADLRLKSDRYLDLRGERAKAERLAKHTRTTDAIGLARTYYEMTFDVDDRRRARFLSHLSRVERRGEALFRALPATGRILEIGCGTGGFVVAARRAGRDVVGVDIASRWLVVADRRLRDRGLFAPLLAADAENLPWSDESFDVVVADSVFEHLDRPERAFAEIYRVLRPRGVLFAWSPNRLSITPDPHVGLWGVGWLPIALRSAYVKARRGCDWTIQPLSPREAKRLGSRAGFRNVALGTPDLSDIHAESEHERIMITFYYYARRTTLVRSFLERFGPLWELTAEK